MNTALPMRALAVVLAAIGLFPLANVLTDGRAVPWWSIAVREWLFRGALAAGVALLLAILLGARLDSVIERGKTWLLHPSGRAFAMMVAAIACVASLALAWYSFSGRPFTSDEMAQQWHARILLSGRFAAVAEQFPEFFNTAPVWDRDGRWFSQYPVGGPAFIAAGLAVGAAWIVNPLLIALAAGQLHAFLARAFDELTARVATLLFLASPMVLVMAASQMNHVAALAFTLVALNALSRWDAAGDGRALRRSAMLVGASLGVVATIRPLDAAVVATIVGAFQIWRARTSRARWASLAAQAVAGAIPVLILFWANARTTGAPLLFGYDALNGPAHRLGFHPDPNGQMHTPARGLAFVSGYVMRLSRYLFEWPLPGVLFVAAGALAIRKPGRWDMLLAAIGLGFLIAYGAYWFDGFFSGPRFLFTALPAFVYFAARAVTFAPSLPSARLRRALLLLVPLCILTAWVGPDGVSSARGRIALYRDQRTKLKTDIEAQVERAGLSNALVFVNEGWRGRLLAKLRVLGATAFAAERMVNTLDACALGDALDDVSRIPALPLPERLDLVARRASGHGVARVVPDLPADQSVAIVPGSLPSASCLAEYRMDVAGTMPYPPFLPLHRVASDGRITGDVVFVRDLGARNELLRSRFGERAWYRYRPARDLRDTASAFAPYARR